MLSPKSLLTSPIFTSLIHFTHSSITTPIHLRTLARTHILLRTSTHIPVSSQGSLRSPSPSDPSQNFVISRAPLHPFPPVRSCPFGPLHIIVSTQSPLHPCPLYTPVPSHSFFAPLPPLNIPFTPLPSHSATSLSAPLKPYPHTPKTSLISVPSHTEDPSLTPLSPSEPPK